MNTSNVICSYCNFVDVVAGTLLMDVWSLNVPLLSLIGLNDGRARALIINKLIGFGMDNFA